MSINKRDNKQDNLNIPNKYEHGDTVFDIPVEKMGWKPQRDEDREFQFKYFNIDLLELPKPPLDLEMSLPYPTTVDGQSVIDAYDQVGGTCVGASGAQATTGRHEQRNPGAGEKFDYIALYCKCRALMGDGGCNKNAGATMQSVGKALRDWGGVQVVNGVSQPANKDHGIASYSWGYDAEAIRTAIGNGLYVQIGISIYQAFLSPKKIGNDWWVYWQDGSWGSMLGGHAMMTCWWSDSHKLTSNSKGAFYLPNTWGRDFPGSWMSYEAFTRLLGAAQPAEILLCIDKVAGPQGKLERVSFITDPSVPVAGDNVTLNLTVKNTGDAPLIGYSLAIEELHNGVGTDGYDNCPVFDLQPGATFTYSPIKTAIETGTWRWWPDVKKDGYRHLGDAMTITVTGTPPPPSPPPPPPPPTDTITTDISVKIGTDTYSADNIILTKEAT